MSSIFKTLHITSSDLFTSAKRLSYHQLSCEITFLGYVIDLVNSRIHTRTTKSKRWDKYVTIVSDMYLEYLPFLYKYIEILDLVNLGKDKMAAYTSLTAKIEFPSFLTKEFFEYNKKLLDSEKTKPMYFIKGDWIYDD